MIGKKGAIAILPVLLAGIVLLVLIFMLPGLLTFVKWMFSSGPQIGPVGIFFIGLFVVLYLRKQVM